MDLSIGCKQWGLKKQIEKISLFVFVGAGGFDDAQGGEGEAQFHLVLCGEDVLLEGFGGVEEFFVFGMFEDLVDQFAGTGFESEFGEGECEIVVPAVVAGFGVLDRAFKAAGGFFVFESVIELEQDDTEVGVCAWFFGCAFHGFSVGGFGLIVKFHGFVKVAELVVSLPIIGVDGDGAFVGGLAFFEVLGEDVEVGEVEPCLVVVGDFFDDPFEVVNGIADLAGCSADSGGFL